MTESLHSPDSKLLLGLTCPRLTGNDTCVSSCPVGLMAVALLLCAGGSAVGSDAIYQEVVKVQRAGKPVVVSMGNLAASGGYYISGPSPLSLPALPIPLSRFAKCAVLSNAEGSKHMSQLRNSMFHDVVWHSSL